MEEELLQPSLRFPEFEEDWTPSTFGNHYSFKNTNSLSREKLNYDEGKVKNIHYGDIHTTFSLLFDVTKEPVPFINPDEAIGNIDDGSYIKDGDLVIADASEDYADIGKTIEVINTNGEYILAGLHTFLARKENNTIAEGFFAFLLNTYKVRLEIMRIAQGTKVLGISKTRLSVIPLYIPKFEEQKKIATFLRAVDKRIKLLKEKKVALEIYKKNIIKKIFKKEIYFKADDGTEFPDWEEKKLSDIAIITTGSTPSTSNREFYNGNYQFVTPADLNNGRYVNKTSTTLTELGFNEGRIISIDSVFFVSIGSTIGKVGQASVECITNQQINSLTAKDLNSNDFIYSLLETKGAKIKLIAGVQAVPQLNKTDFSNLKFPIPNPEEQKKIATFIKKTDTKIEVLDNLIAENSKYQKSLIQNLFI